jgi:DNA-binding CsgD family transcriptional regulator
LSIVQSIDAEITGVNEEISALEAQLDGKRGHLDKLNALREQAQSLNAEGGGLPDVAVKSPSRPEPTAPSKPAGAPPPRTAASATAEGVWRVRVEAIVALVAKHPDGISASEIRRHLHLSANQFRALRPMLASKIDREGTGRATVYYPKEDVDRPSHAPTGERRATPAPASKPRAAKEPAPLSAKAEQAMALSARLQQAIVELVADSEPITGEEVTTMILEQIPEAERAEVLTARQRALREHKIEIWGDAYRVPKSSSGPITEAERQAVACLGSGRTAKEVALNCDGIKTAFSARAICEGLVRRGVIGKRAGSEPPVFEVLEQGAEAA